MSNFAKFATLAFLSFVQFSEGKAKNLKRPVEALEIAQQFTDAINQSRFGEAYLLTDKKSRFAPTWFSSLENFTERAKHERPFSEKHPGNSKLQEFTFVDSNTLRVEFLFQFEVRLCRQITKTWKVCYFQTHAG